MSDKLETTNCPQCGHTTLKIDVRLTAKDIGDFSLAGNQMKFSAHWKPYLFCWRPECDYERAGWFDDTNHAVFRK